MSPKTTNLISAGALFRIDVFDPSGIASAGAVIIMHGSDGPVDNASGPWLNMMTGYANDLADKGIVALMPHYFCGAEAVDFSLLKNYQTTLADTVAYAKTLPGVDAARIGLLGFSLGGYLCLRERALAKVLVEFFAPIFSEVGGIGTKGNPRLHAQIHHGKDDRLVKFELNAKPIEQQLRSEGADVEPHAYEHAGHGFNGEQSGDAVANSQAKKSTLAFFGKYL